MLVAKCLLVDGVLVLGSLQFDGDFLLGLVDLNIFAVGAEAGGDYLHAQLAEGDAIHIGLALGIGLQLHATFLLVAFAIHRMQDPLPLAARGRLPKIFVCPAYLLVKIDLGRGPSWTYKIPSTEQGFSKTQKSRHS